MLVEDFANPVPWTKPEDLTIDQVVEIFQRSNQVGGQQCCAHELHHSFSKVIGGNSVLLLDGTSHSIGLCKQFEKIRQLCTINDGQLVSIEDLKQKSRVIPKWGEWITLVAWVSLLLLPGWVLRRRSVPR